MHSMYSGWSVIREKILAKFQISKDIEFLFIHHQLEEVLRIMALQHPVAFLASNSDLCRLLKERLALQFILWQRRNYNKAMLAALSDEAHQLKFAPIRHIYLNYLPLITERKVGSISQRTKKTNQ